MSFDWAEFLVLAERLIGINVIPSQDAKLRCAISRSYFGAFCKTRNFLIAEGENIPRTWEAHQKVRDVLEESADVKRRQISLNLDRLRVDRNKADYRNMIEGLPQTANATLSIAKNVINTLGRI